MPLWTASLLVDRYIGFRVQGVREGPEGRRKLARPLGGRGSAVTVLGALPLLSPILCPTRAGWASTIFMCRKIVHCALHCALKNVDFFMRQKMVSWVLKHKAIRHSNSDSYGITLKIAKKYHFCSARKLRLFRAHKFFFDTRS